MSNLISFRPDENTLEKLNKLQTAEGKNKSEIIRDSLDEYYQRHYREKSPWELGKDLFGAGASEVEDLGQDHEKHVQEKFESEA